MSTIDPACCCESRHPPDDSPDVAIEDLDLLFAAVTARLKSLARPRSGNAGAEAARIRASVLDCVQALEQLHVTAMHEVSRLHQFELASATQATP
jgi:hypothetical protein